MAKRLVENLLHKDLSYQIHGAAIEVRKDFGPGHKEVLYQNAFAQELRRRNIAFLREPAIKVHSPKDGGYVGLYRPDFVVDGKVIVEVKAERFVRRDELRRLYDYLRNSSYELAYFINFASPRLFVKRIILTNDHKHFLAKLLVSISFILVSFSGLPTKAAQVYLLPQAGEYQVGETFLAELRVNSEGEAVNAFAIGLLFPPEVLEVAEVIDGGSLLDLWITRPTYSNADGALSFQAGRAGGFSGEGVLLKLLFRAKAPGTGTITFSPASQVFLHDGRGTPASGTFSSARYIVTKAARGAIILSSPSHPREDTWYGAAAIEIRWPAEPGALSSYVLSRDVIQNPDQAADEPVGVLTYRDPLDGIYYFSLAESLGGNIWSAPVRYRVMQDATPPEPFEVSIGRDERSAGGQHFLTFSAQDQASGIDHYEVSERRWRFLGRDQWQRRESPFILADQERKSMIKVRAVDRAGNERIVTVAPQQPSVLEYLIIAALLGFAGITILLLWRRLIPH